MDEHEYGEGGFRIEIMSCERMLTLRISSFSSARIKADANGMVALECSDASLLLATVIPSKETMQSMYAGFFGGEGIGMMEPSHEGDHQHDQKTLLLPDELSLEMWLNTEFIPGLSLFCEDGAAGDFTEQMTTMSRRIMVEVMSSKASADVRRRWR